MDRVYTRGPYKLKPPVFWPRVNKAAPNGCWQWLGRLKASGYGRICIQGRTLQAHRVAYELVIGPIPAGLVLDHLCRNRSCVNPAHLRPCTHRENILAPGSESRSKRAHEATQCPRGHSYDLLNTLVNSQGNRVCRACERLRWHRRKFPA